MAGPLDGVRVLELPAIGPVPFLGMLLSDLGAEVIRIDRLSGASGLADALAGSPLGRVRRSIGLDLRKPGGAELALRIAETSDALIEGFRPVVAERLGIGPAAGPPVPPANYVADFGGGAMFLATGLLAALLHARATGEGQVVDAAMTEGASYLGSMTRTFVSRGGWTDEREANMLDGGAPNYRCYETADGKWLAVGPIEPQFWSALLKTLGLDEATTPTPYAPDDWDACKKVLGDTFRTKTRDEWAEIFTPLDACVAPVLTLAEALEHPHNVARGSFVDVAGATVAAPAPRFSATATTAAAPSERDTDTASVLAELGYDDAEVARLRQDGALG